MKYKFSDLISRRERTKEVNFEFDMAPFHFEGEKMEPLSKVVVNGNIVSKNDEVLVDLHVQTKLKLVCSRCLETFIYPIDIDIEERFTNSEERRGDEDVVFVIGDELDIAEIVESEIISTLPIKRLCTNNCKGLCQTCGKNLNKESCTCDNDNIDVRLAGLKALLENKEV